MEELSSEEIMEYGAKVFVMRMTGIEGAYLAPEPGGMLDDEKLEEEIEKIFGKLSIDKKNEPELKVWVAALEGAKIVPAKSLRTHPHLFNEDNVSRLPTFDLVHHEINTTMDPPSLPLYPLNEVQLAALRAYLTEGVKLGRIRPSRSPAGTPVLFVPKKDGGLRLCVDYRGLNKVTIKDKTSLPLIAETLDRFQGAKRFTKLDLKDAYHRIRIREGDEWKTAFRTRYGHFEYQVMPFGHCNAPATFQAYINCALTGLLDIICVVYLDDILIYLRNMNERDEHVKLVLDHLSEFKLYINPRKCAFGIEKVNS